VFYVYDIITISYIYGGDILMHGITGILACRSSFQMLKTLRGTSSERRRKIKL